MKLLETVYILDGIVFIYIMIVLLVIFSHQNKAHAKVLPKEGFCTCRGAGYNNSAADLHQNNCYMNKIPKKIWNQSYAGCTTFEDAGKIAYQYEIDQKQLPEFMGV